MAQLTESQAQAWQKAQMDGVSWAVFCAEMGIDIAPPTAVADYAASATGGAPTPTAVPGTGEAFPNRPEALGGPANVRDGAKIASAPDEAAQAADPDYIKLKDGRVAYVGTGTGRLIPKARRIMEDDGSNFTDCLAALVTTIDGKPLNIDDLYELPIQDSMAIIARNNVKNVA